MHYAPKLSPQPITAIRLDRDLHAKKGAWLAITDSGQVKIISDETFRLLYAPSEAPTRRPTTKGWHPEQLQAAVLRALDSACQAQEWVTTSDISQWLSKEWPKANISARLAGLVNLGFAVRGRGNVGVRYRITDEGRRQVAKDQEWFASRHAA